MEYQDFTIGIRSAGENLFEATVLDAPLKERPRIYFPPPLDRVELQALLESCEKPGAGAVPDRKIGKRLHSSLFQGELAEVFKKCRSALAGDGEAGLRLRLTFGMGDPEIEYLAALPWEWLWDPETRAFLATERKNPVVRDFAIRQFQSAREVVAPLRILVVDAAPRDLHELKLRSEIERMVEALEPLQEKGWVQLFRLLEPTPEALRHALRDLEIHVLHFMGHAGYHAETGYGALFFVKPDRTKDQVDGERLSNLLKDLPDLRLVVLNACKTARYAGRMGSPLYSGVASAILERAGVPAVLANQCLISDAAAIELSRALYRCIAAGERIDAAVTEVRLLLQGKSTEWGTPVLFLGAPHGRLFAATPPKSYHDVGVVDASQLAAEPVRLGIRTFHGHGGDMKARNEAVLDRVEYFDPTKLNGRLILDQKWWQEKVFPDLRSFLEKNVDRRRPVLLDLAAHASIAFAAGWILEAKSGIDVRVRQRIQNLKELEWRPDDGSAREEELPWLDRPDIRLSKGAPDVAVALAVSQPAVADHVEAFIKAKGLPVGRIIDAVVAPEPGPHAVRGGAHALRLAQTLLPRIRKRYPHERSGKLHLFCAAPNALLVYLGQIARSLGTVVLYEFAFNGADNFGRYQASIELPPPDERAIPEGW